MLLADLLEDSPGMSAESDSFKASRGWFDKFKKRSGIHCVVKHGEAASSNKVAADNSVTGFQEYVEADGFVPQQVFVMREALLEENAKEDIHHTGK